MNVLIVEDEEFNQIVIREMLDILYPHLNIDSSENGVEALERLKEKSYDLILSDIDMPKMDGNQFLKTIRQDSQLSTPVIAVTAYAITGDRERLLLFGFDNYIAKPIDIEQLKFILDPYIFKEKNLLDLEVFTSIEEVNYEKNERYMVFITEDFKEDYLKFFENSNHAVQAGVIVPHLIVNTQLIHSGIALLKLKQSNTFVELLDMHEPVQKLIEKISEYDVQNLFLFVDGLSSHFETFISNINEELDSDKVSVVGSGVGVKDLTAQPVVFNRTGIFQNHAIALGTNLTFTGSVQHGWHSMYGPLVVTKSKDNIIYELNGQNAFDVYKKTLEELEGVSISSKNFFEIAKSYPLGVMTFSDSEFIIRDPISVNADGSIVIVSSVEEYNSLFIMKGEKKTLIDSSKKLSDEVFAKTNSQSAILFDCISRVLFLEEEFQEELTALFPQNRPDCQLFGLTCIGEITNINFNSIKILNKTTLLGTLS